MPALVARFKRFIRSIRRHGPVLVACLGLGAALLVGILFFLPKADAESARAALTVIAEILGVILGAVLVVAGLLIEQSWQAEALLRRIQPQYRSLIDANIGALNDARRELVDHTKRRRIQLDDPVFLASTGEPSSMKFRDALQALSALTYAFSTGPLVEQIEKDLEYLGYSEDEIAHTLYVVGLTAERDPEAFLRLAGDALDLTWISAWCSDKPSSLALDLYERYGRDGVSVALARLERSRAFLQSRLLAASILLPAITLVWAIVTILGTTDEAVSLGLHAWMTAIIAAAFVASLALAMSLIRRMLSDPR